MGSLFGGGGGGGTSYIPAPAPVQATQPRAVDANKQVNDASNRQKQLIAASANGSNNIMNGGMGLNNDAKKKDKNLLGGT